MIAQNSDIYQKLFDPLIPKMLSRRIKKECEVLLQKGGNISIEKNSNGDIMVELQRLEGNYISKYSFMMPLNYPFMPPRIRINDQNHYDFCNLHSNRFTTILQYIKGIDCLCCHSHICKNNWAPGLTLDHILKQINEYKKLKYYISLKLLADQIKYKYLVMDINLDSWLFDIACPRVCLPNQTIL
jgi:ubiquitin-protein ligase